MDGRTPDARSKAASRAALARAGEDAAARHLADRGYVILQRNLTVGDDEADLLALTPGGSVAVVEVKTRTGPWHPEDRVDAVKRARLVRLAAALSARDGFRERLFQFDVVAVSMPPGMPPAVTHWPHAFDAGNAPW
jgi:putative endonuclease